MQLRAWGAAPSLALLALLLPAPTAGAGEPGDGQTTLSVKAAGYAQLDSGGIEEVDEDAFVVEGILLLDVHVTDTDRLKVKVLGDVVSAASIRREHNPRYRALQSEATGTTRLGGQLGWTHRFGDLDLSLHGSGATEYAYTSFGAGTNLAWRLLESNTTLSLGVDAFFDTVHMIRFNGDQEDAQARTTVTASLGWTQILTARALLNLSLGYTRQGGFLAGQFNSVFVDGVEDYEILPRTRDRGSVTARFKHAVGAKDAVEAGARVYTDSWGLTAGTVDLRYFFHFASRLQLEAGYRFHAQTGASYYARRFAQAATYQTSDPDLGDFTGHKLGLTLRIFDPSQPGAAGDWDVGLAWYHRDNGLDAFWLTLGTTFGF